MCPTRHGMENKYEEVKIFGRIIDGRGGIDRRLRRG